MSKSRIAALVVAIAMIGMPVALGSTVAFAANSTGTSDTSAAPSFSAADRDEDEDDEDADESESGHHQGVIPPVVIRPHQEGDEYGEDDDEDEDDEDGAGGSLPPLPNASPSPSASAGSSNPYGPAYNKGGQFVIAPLGGPGANGGPGAGPRVSKIDPQAAPPIAMNGVQTSIKTPSEIFVESATVGLTAMGVGALALGGVAGVRAIRLRKNPTEDYFYDSEK